MPTAFRTIYEYRGKNYTMRELADLPQCQREYNTLSHCIRKTTSTVQFCVESPLGTKSEGAVEPVNVVYVNKKQAALDEQFQHFQELMKYMKPTSVSKLPEGWKSYGRTRN